MQKTFDYKALQSLASENVMQGEWDPEQLQRFCRSVLQSAFPTFRDTNIEVHFYPYVGLTHTLRRKNSGWLLRISDHCRKAPSKVLESVVLILGHKVMHRKPPRKAVDTYNRFRMDPETEAEVRSRRLQRGRKQFSNKAGKHHSLRKIYSELNELYFNGQIEINRIGWGLRKGLDRLGHYDPVHHTITLSPALDSPAVPDFVVRYIVYHEMLHALFGDKPVKGFRKHHPREFRHTECAYPDYKRAKKFLETFSRRRRRKT